MSPLVSEVKPSYGAEFSVKKEMPDSVCGPVDISNSFFGSQPPKKRQLIFQGSKKPCNCTKSQCLKLYCDCFANGEFCRNCHCTNCKNNLTYEIDRSKAIKSCLERNPLAFQPKIGKGRIDTERLHNKGCNCKKSSCLKNYCECYEARVPCTARCKCNGCRNTEADRSNRGRPCSSLPQWRTTSPSDMSVCSQICEYPVKPDSPLSTDTQESAEFKKFPWDFMSDDAVDATALCLIAQVQELSKKNSIDFLNVQSAVLEEFGRCLQQIIQSVS
ncbi:unnamed protein product [Soboliphyme baturini]|uniref:CRC domain-containing protein n=1 Tax=Soboliphyme baturini TaxID=241478 RepID=A0A183J6E3_9BILA|nr:unnamed protein product [Soboliphyme baturini]